MNKRNNRNRHTVMENKLMAAKWEVGGLLGGEKVTACVQEQTKECMSPFLCYFLFIRKKKKRNIEYMLTNSPPQFF